MTTQAYLGLGANLGDRLENLRRAVELLDRHPRVEVVRTSRVFETDPMGGPPQPPYLNAVAEIRTDLEPRELLRVCNEVESDLCRVRKERWGPRTVDVDVLGYDRREVDEPDLSIPHPRMHERAFVLVPLLELTADPMLPGGRSISSLRMGSEGLTGVRPFAPPLTVGP